MKRILIVSDVHFCQFEYGGIPRDEKAQRLVAQIKEEYEKEPFELILFLGDYSLDHWAWQTKGTWLTHKKSYTKEFIDRFCAELPAPYYMLAGNHEQYGEKLWRELTGFGRSEEIVVDDCLFILWDSFGGELDPTEHSDGCYTPPKCEEIRAIMDKHPDKRVFLCSHWFSPCGSEAEKELIRDERVVCLFQGHTHSSKILTLPEDYGSKRILQAGSWAGINSSATERWGVRDLCIYEDRISSSYIVKEHSLSDDDGKAYVFPAEIRDSIEL